MRVSDSVKRFWRPCVFREALYCRVLMRVCHRVMMVQIYSILYSRITTVRYQIFERLRAASAAIERGIEIKYTKEHLPGARHRVRMSTSLTRGFVFVCGSRIRMCRAEIDVTTYTMSEKHPWRQRPWRQRVWRQSPEGSACICYCGSRQHLRQPFGG